MATILDMTDYRVETYKHDLKTKAGNEYSSLDLKLIRKSDGAFVVLEAGGQTDADELLWLLADGASKEALEGVVRGTVAMLTKAFPDGLFWERSAEAA